MDYSDQHNYQSSNHDQPLFETDSESEFDAFEHHLSQYENKEDEELFNDDESIMFHDGSRLEEDSLHQISLATSFCRNTQEQNENFLEDKFNGDLLLEQFSEDKFIKCKYSEDFYYEQQFIETNKQLISESDEEHAEDKKLIEERSSEDERVIEKRKLHFIEFISTIPKVCTPSVCGTMSEKRHRPISNYQTENKDHLNRLTEANEELLFEDDEHDIITSTQKPTNDEPQQPNFDWSIDQLATLKPVDISFDERRFLRFKSFESDQLTQERLIKENDLFFSQEKIAPSPTKNRVFKNVGLNDSKLVYGSKRFNDLTDSSKTNIVNDNRMNKMDNSRLNKSSNDKLINEINKDSGTYSEDNQEMRTNLNEKLDDQFEFSFIEHSNKNLSEIEFDYELEHSQYSPLINSKNRSFVQPSTRPNLDFEPNPIPQQTSTPCASLFKLKEFDTNFNQFNRNIQNDSEKATNKQVNTNRLPLQERSNIKQKRRLFHNLTDSLIYSASSSSISSSTNASTDTSNSTSDNSISNNSTNSLQLTNDEGIDQCSKEITFGSNASFLMSVCDNNSLTPRPKKSRSSVHKSFAERLNEIELVNDENRSINTNLTTDQVRWQNLTDSNCFMIKNLNNFNFNNSDSGCYLSNASNGSDAEVKRQILFS